MNSRKILKYHAYSKADNNLVMYYSFIETDIKLKNKAEINIHSYKDW